MHGCMLNVGITKQVCAVLPTAPGRTYSTNALSRVARTAGSTTAIIASTASANIAALIGRSTKIIGSPRDSGAFAAREAVLREKRHALVNVVTSY